MARQLVYYSRTGLTGRFAKRFGGVGLEEYDGTSEYIIVVPSYGQPRKKSWVPQPVKDFLDTHADNLVGVIGLGNRNFGAEFNLGSRQISQRFNIPIVADIDIVPTGQEEEAIWRSLQSPSL